MDESSMEMTEGQDEKRMESPITPEQIKGEFRDFVDSTFNKEGDVSEYKGEDRNTERAQLLNQDEIGSGSQLFVLSEVEGKGAIRRQYFSYDPQMKQGAEPKEGAFSKTAELRVDPKTKAYQISHAVNTSLERPNEYGQYELHDQLRVNEGDLVGYSSRLRLRGEEDRLIDLAPVWGSEGLIDVVGAYYAVSPDGKTFNCLGNLGGYLKSSDVPAGQRKIIEGWEGSAKFIVEGTEDAIVISAIEDDKVKITRSVPRHIDRDMIASRLFSEQTGMPEGEVNRRIEWYKEELINRRVPNEQIPHMVAEFKKNIPYEMPFLLVHPDIKRSEFKDHGPQFDPDFSWRSVSLADAVGIKTEMPRE